MNVLITKARQALRSAHVLLDLGDLPGAANRTYYAIFDAMRACIMHRTDIDIKEIKTHHGVFRLFEKHVLAAGLVDAKIARVIYRAQELRWGGDYAVRTDLSGPDIAQTLESAAAFVGICASLVGTDEEKP